MSEFKAIQTKYKGITFRSRAEARYAVAFDKMGIKWQYEPEGVILEDGTKYLPDFLIGEFQKLYIEVKKNDFTKYDRKKVELFAKKKNIYCLPSFIPHNEDDLVQLHDDTFGFFFSGLYLNGDNFPYIFTGIKGKTKMQPLENQDFSFMQDFLYAAMNAKFEFWENNIEYEEGCILDFSSIPKNAEYYGYNLNKVNENKEGLIIEILEKQHGKSATILFKDWTVRHIAVHILEKYKVQIKGYGDIAGAKYLLFG